jgi:hypothetical protein
MAPCGPLYSLQRVCRRKGLASHELTESWLLITIRMPLSADRGAA